MRKETAKRMFATSAVYLVALIACRILFEVGFITTQDQLRQCQQCVVGVWLGTFLVLIYYGLKNK